ncbi:MAG: antibiotic biosynthesis monooxygenase [Opitutales bacterium]|nr:antibiotic biosynthesis monooxygenase [Opitutales bacterium]
MTALKMRLLAALAALTALLTGCAYTAPYRSTALARGEALDPEEIVIVALSATEHRPGKRRDFFTDTRRVLADLPDQDGLLGYSFRFEIFGNEAWTMTAWRDEAALQAFVRSPAHAEAVRASGQTAQNIRFVTLHRPLSSLPVRWSEALPLLQAASPRSSPAHASSPFPQPQ